MPTIFEDTMSYLEVVLVVVFNPFTWLVVAFFAFRSKPIWQLVFHGTLVQFITMAAINFYHSKTLVSIVDLEWLAVIVPVSFAAGTAVGTILFFLFKWRREHHQHEYWKEH